MATKSVLAAGPLQLTGTADGQQFGKTAMHKCARSAGHSDSTDGALQLLQRVAAIGVQPTITRGLWYCPMAGRVGMLRIYMCPALRAALRSGQAELPSKARLRLLRGSAQMADATCCPADHCTSLHLFRHSCGAWSFGLAALGSDTELEAVVSS